MAPANSVWTRADFETWLRDARVKIYVDPYEIIACHCGDVNCHGWRLVPSWGRV